MNHKFFGIVALSWSYAKGVVGETQCLQLMRVQVEILSTFMWSANGLSVGVYNLPFSAPAFLPIVSSQRRGGCEYYARFQTIFPVHRHVRVNPIIIANSAANSKSSNG